MCVRVRACVCVCVYVYLCVCVCVCICVCICVWLYIYIYVCVCLCKKFFFYLCVYVFLYICVCVWQRERERERERETERERERERVTPNTTLLETKDYETHRRANPLRQRYSGVECVIINIYIIHNLTTTTPPPPLPTPHPTPFSWDLGLCQPSSLSLSPETLNARLNCWHIQRQIYICIVLAFCEMSGRELGLAMTGDVTNVCPSTHKLWRN